MRYASLGGTGLRVSALGLGGSSLAGVFRPVDEREATRAVRVALDLGVNYIDTAPYYGLTRAEAVLGRALRGVPREAYVLATKVGRYGTDDFDFSAARVARSVDESLARLGVEYVDVIQAHDVEFGDLTQVVEETMPALRRVVEQGKARVVGVTGYSLLALATVLDGAGAEMVLSYCHFTPQNTRLAGVAPGWRARGLGVVNAAPLAMGLLTPAGPPEWHPATGAIRAACAEAAAACVAMGADLADVALRFALSATVADTTVVGSADESEIRRNVATLDGPPPPDVLAAVERALAPMRDAVWPTGRPENA